MDLSEVLSIFLTSDDLYKFTRVNDIDTFWYQMKGNKLFGILESDGIPVKVSIPLCDILAKDWVIDYKDDKDARKK